MGKNSYESMKDDFVKLVYFVIAVPVILVILACLPEWVWGIFQWVWVILPYVAYIILGVSVTVVILLLQGASRQGIDD